MFSEIKKDQNEIRETESIYQRTTFQIRTLKI